jgi:hypothetical protein
MQQNPCYPEIPKLPRPEVVTPGVQRKKKTKANMWRKWREDDENDVEMALLNDLVEKSFDAKLFLKDEDDT